MIAVLLYFSLGLIAGGVVLRRNFPSAGALLALGMSLTILMGFISIKLFGDMSNLLFIFVFSFFILPVQMYRNRSFLQVRNERAYRPWKANPARLLWLVTFVGGAGILFALSGRPLINYDVLSYHIPIARDFADSSRVASTIATPDIFYEYLPLGASIL